MRKISQKGANFVPPLKATLVPEEQRNDVKFRADFQSWLEDLKASGIFKASSLFVYEMPVDAAFIEWCERTIGEADPVLQHLFFQHGLAPSFILEILSSLKLWQVNYERYGKPLKILRTAKSREHRARMLEKAAAALDELPLYRGGLNDMVHPVSLPEQLKASANSIRKHEVQGNRRPPAIVPRMAATYLATQFKTITGYPLYQYVGELIKAAFPDEWNPAGDIRGAAKKLVKAQPLSTVNGD